MPLQTMNIGFRIIKVCLENKSHTGDLYAKITKARAVSFQYKAKLFSNRGLNVCN